MYIYANDSYNYIAILYVHAETMTCITQPDVHSIGIQCNLLVAPPLKKIQYKEEEFLHSEEISIHLFVFPRRILQQSKYKFINTYKHLINNELILIYNSDDIEQPSSSASILDEVKYIVFKSSLMELFTHCSVCHNTCTGEVAYKVGTFISVKQHCSYRDHQQLWSSQPRIKDTPAWNVLLSAAILLSGATL